MYDKLPEEKFPINPHHELPETFADQVGTMYFDGSALRIEFLVTRVEQPSPPPKEERHVVSRLVLSPRCTIDLINQLNKLSTTLTQSGLFKTNPPPP
jgi:hypothetical protein